jgi:hypothetical protein
MQQVVTVKLIDNGLLLEKVLIFITAGRFYVDREYPCVSMHWRRHGKTG